MTRNLFLSTLAAGLTLASGARAQERTPAAGAALKGLKEVTISKIGVEHATDADLKKFSEQMIADHTKANRELMDLAATKGIALPTALDVKTQFCGQSLAGLSGKDFDNCYAKAQFLAHMDAVSEFETEAERGQDPEIKTWAAKTLPKIKQHLAMIKPHAMKAEKEKPSADDSHSER